MLSPKEITVTEPFSVMRTGYPLWPTAALALAVAVLYYVFARVGMMMEFGNTQASPVWPPTGLAVSAVLVFGYRIWPGVYLGAAAANVAFAYLNYPDAPATMNPATVGLFLSDHPVELVKALVIGTGNTLEAVACLYLLDKFKAQRDPFRRARDVLVFTLSILAACAISASIGTTSVCAGGAPWRLFGDIWLTWWIGDVAGGLLLVPIFIVGARTLLTRSDAPLFGNNREFLLATLSILAVALVALATFRELAGIALFQAQAYLLLPCLILIVFRFGFGAGTIAATVVAGIAVSGTLDGQGPFVREDQNISLMLLVGFVSMIAITITSIAAILEERAKSSEALEDLDRSQNDLEKLNDRLRMLDEMKSEFVRTVSHELRTPLAAISGATGNLTAGYLGKLTDDQSETVEIIKRNSERLNRLIVDILDISRIESGKLSFEKNEFDLAKALGRIAVDLAPLFEKKGMALEIDAPDEGVTLNADQDRVIQIITNLLGNAVRFAATRVKASVKRNGSVIRLIVEDDGNGISEEFQGELFKPFSTDPGSHEKSKSGLGLSIVKGIVDRHGGRVYAENISEGGATGARFVVEFEG